MDTPDTPLKWFVDSGEGIAKWVPGRLLLVDEYVSPGFFGATEPGTYLLCATSGKQSYYISESRITDLEIALDFVKGNARVV